MQQLIFLNLYIKAFTSCFYFFLLVSKARIFFLALMLSHVHHISKKFYLFAVCMSYCQSFVMVSHFKGRVILKIGENFLRDERVESVLSVKIERNDLQPQLTKITVRVKLTGFSDAADLRFIPFGGEDL